MDQNRTDHVPTEAEIAQLEAEAARHLAGEEDEKPAAQAFVPYVDDVPDPSPKRAPEAEDILGDDEDGEYIPSEWEKRIDRLKQDYIRKARQKGVDLKCILHDVPDLKARIGTPDAVVIFTKQISHEARRKAIEHAKAQNIQVHMLHSCSISSLCGCFASR